MRVVYQSIWIELPYEVVQVIDVTMTEHMNHHAYLQMTAVIEEEKEEEFIYHSAEGEWVKAGFCGEATSQAPFFVGCINQVIVAYEKGQRVVTMVAASMTQTWDIVKKRRTFQNLDFTYADVIQEILADYSGASWISCVETSKKIPGLLLQYNETDWEFLCRLASHFEAYVMTAPCGEAGQIYFGLPEISYGNTIDSFHYTLAQDMERYQFYAENISKGMLLQDNLRWEVRSRTAYALGEKVTWKEVPCQITSVVLKVCGAETIYTYLVERTKGVKAPFYGNQEIAGLSLPAVIKERKGNCLRVQFSIDDTYEAGNNVFFTFAIETTSWYCMPELESMVHIYFPSWEETKGIAIHAMRMQGSSITSSVSAKGAIEDKSFSTSDGKVMKMTQEGIIFDAEEEVETSSCLMVCKDGTLHIDGEDITLYAQSNLNIGSGWIFVNKEWKELIPQDTIIQAEAGTLGLGFLIFGEEEVTLSKDIGICMDESGNFILIASGVVSYDAEKKSVPSIQYSDAKLKEEDAKQREEHNAEVFEVREREAKGKWGVGAVVAGIGMICLIGAVATAGVGLAVVGAVALACGTAQVEEGKKDLEKMKSGDFSQSYNAIRDEFFDGNQDIYNMVMYGSVMIGIGMLLAPLAGKIVASVAKKIPTLIKGTGRLAEGGRWLATEGSKMLMQGVTTGSVSTLTMGLQDINDGYVDESAAAYLTNFGTTAGINMLGFAIGEGAIGIGKKFLNTALTKGNAANPALTNTILTKAAPFAPVLKLGAETAIDVGTDWAVSKVFGLEFEAGMATLESLAGNVMDSVDPVNMATGAFFLTATDFLLPDLMEEEFQFQRMYNSLVCCRGSIGTNWMLGIESRLFFREELGQIDVLCMDGHAERFCLEEGEWKNRRQGDCRYQLKKTEDGFVLLYVPEQKQYHYNSLGRLESVQGKGKTKLKLEYEENHIRRLITSSGCVLTFVYQNDLLVEVKDEMGRMLRYKYENDRLQAVCHIDEGTTTYHYDDKNHITQIIDQNGHTYVTNEYDDIGRLIAQYYLDGTKSVVTYDEKHRENTVYIESLHRTERYRYNENSLVTHTYYEDGTWEEIGYDQWTNHSYEKDRNGNETRRVFDIRGLLLEEILPSGQQWNYTYDAQGNLLSKRANTGEETTYTYNEHGFLIEQADKIREGVWKRKFYERDDYGRILQETDSLGNITRYRYENAKGYRFKEPSSIENAMGHKTVYEYDAVGRRTSITTEYGTVEQRYNRQNYPTYVRDGNGNELRKTYDKLGNLLAVFSPNEGANGKAWLYEYDFFDRLIETKDPLGNRWKTERNLAGDILREITPEGHETRYEYDTDSRKLRTIYPDGSVERCFYDANGNLIKKVRPECYQPQLDDGQGITYEYDNSNRLIKVIEEDGTVKECYVYDTSGNLIEESNRTGYKTFHTYDYLGNCTATWKPIEKQEDDIWYGMTVYEYDTEGNKIVEKRGLDKVKRGEYAKRFHELSFSYDELHRLTKIKDALGGEICYTYNCLNQKTSETIRMSSEVERKICYVYDVAGNVIQQKEAIEERFLKPNGTKRTKWAVTTYEYDKNGNCTKIISPKGYETKKAYDVLDRVSKEEEIDTANGIHRNYQYVYDKDNNLIERVDNSRVSQMTRQFRYDNRGRLTHWTDETNATTRLFYDRNNRVTKVVQPEQYEEETDTGAGVSYTYDCYDNIIKIIGADGSILQENTYDSAGNLTSVVEGNSIYTEYAYHLSGNPFAVYTGRDNAKQKNPVQSLSYDAWGTVTKVEDGNHNQTNFILDDWGRITEVHLPDGGVEKYTYDYVGNITSTTDANGGTITYHYNSMGQVCEIVDQQGHSEFFYYDEEGRQETHIDRNGNVERTLYNRDNHLVYQRAEDKKGRYPVVNQYLYYPDGTLKEAIGGGITYHYDYTAHGLLQRKSSAKTPLLEYAYDKNRNIVQRTDITGNHTHYTYNVLNRLEQVTKENGELLASYRYTIAGQMEQLCYGNGVKTNYCYRDDGKPERLVTVTPQGEVLLNYEYAYDGTGNCIKKSGQRYQNEYTYDKKNQLKTASYNGIWESYTYDKVGNRIQKQTKEGTEFYTYNTKNQLTSIKTNTGRTDFRYDMQGNLREERGIEKKQYFYDALNRLSTVKTNELWQKNRYDAERLRHEVEENGVVSRFIFDNGELSAEETKENTICYLYGKERVVASKVNGAETGYHIQDEAGSTLFLLDETHKIQKTYHYDAFGMILEESGDTLNRLTYTGQQYDTATGQYYLRARFYNPALGRFLQEDVYRGDGLNLYAYCKNHPVAYYDPSGYKGLNCDPYAGKTNAGNKSDNYSSLRDLMSPEEVARYDEHWLNVAENISNEVLDNQIAFIKSGGITKPGGGKFKPAKISATVDLNTGDIYFGYNGANKFNPSKMDIHPVLQEKIQYTKNLAANSLANPFASKQSFEIWSVDNCAEVYSANNALLNGTSWDNLFINTKYFKNGEWASPCENCKITFKNVYMPKKGN